MTTLLVIYVVGALGVGAIVVWASYGDCPLCDGPCRSDGGPSVTLLLVVLWPLAIVIFGASRITTTGRRPP